MKKNYGFTIIEILVSVGLIALLSTIGITGFQAITRGGRDALRKTELEKIRSALEIFKSDYGYYPDLSEECIADLPPQYMSDYPQDPKSPDSRYCYIRVNELSYKICAHLENGVEPDEPLCPEVSNSCDSSGISNCNFMVSNP